MRFGRADPCHCSTPLPICSLPVSNLLLRCVNPSDRQDLSTSLIDSGHTNETYTSARRTHRERVLSANREATAPDRHVIACSRARLAYIPRMCSHLYPPALLHLHRPRSVYLSCSIAMSDSDKDVDMADVGSTTVQLPALARLPFELVECITWRLDIQDAKRLYHAIKFSKKHLAVAVYIRSRLSVADYINSNLGDSGVILKSMSLNLVYMSGSGALEFFKPGVRGPKSDWDFYAPNEVMLVSAFMWDMEKVGVKWKSPLDQAKEFMNESGGRMRMQREALIQVLEENTLWELVSANDFQLRISLFGEEFANVLVEDVEAAHMCLNAIIREEEIPFFRVEIDTNMKGVVIEAGNDFTDYDDISNIKRVIKGELRRCGRTVEIQLMVEARDHPFDTASVFCFHSSAVQCFIGGHVACHYYGKSALEGTNYLWSDFIQKEKNMNAVQKYVDRGFRLKKLPRPRDGAKCRVADGKQAIFLGSYNFTGREDWVERAIEIHARTTFWRENRKRTLLVEGPLKDTRRAWTMGYMSHQKVLEHLRWLPAHTVAEQWAVGRRS